MTFENIRLKIGEIALRVFEKAGMDIVDLKVAGHKNDVMIEITADKPSGGINIRECAILNKSLVAAIEQEQFLPPEHFSLELSSPGLDRALVTRKDFLRVKAMELHFWLNGPVNGKNEVQGILSDVTETELTVEAGGLKLVLPLTSVIKGMLVI